MMIPSGLMKQFPADFNKSVVLKKNVYKNCLELYTIDAWKTTLAKLQDNHSFEEEYEDFVRNYVDGNTLVDIDNSNRILIPKILCEHAGIKKEVFLKTQMDKIEIWSVENYEEFKKSFDKKEFSAKAKQMMSRKKSAE